MTILNQPLLDALSDGILVLEEDRIIYANDEIIEFLGFSLEELIHKSIADIFHCPTQQFEDKSNNLHKNKITIKDKKCREVEWTKRPYWENNREYSILVIKGVEGTENLPQKSYRDKVSVSLSHYDELKSSEKLFKRLIGMLPSAVLLYKNGELTFINEAGCKLSGHQNREELIGKRVGEIMTIASKDEKTVRKRLRKLWGQEEKLGFKEHSIISKNHKEIQVEQGGFSFFHGKDLYTTTIIRDITQHKKNQELRKKIQEKKRLIKEIREYERLKADFFSTISHEFKTPINIILTAVQLLASQHQEEHDCPHYHLVKKYLHILRQNSYRLLKIANNIIDINKMEAGYMQLNLKNYNVVNVVEDITLSIVDYAQQKGINIIFDTDVEEKIIACDGEKIERIMLNLLSNAIKFSENPGEIIVSVYNKDDNVYISAKDDGVGIPSDMIDKIFDPFRQVDQLLRRRSEGNGIGLALVKSMVNLHKGNIRVKSKLKEGTEFIIELPAKQIKENNKNKKDINSFQMQSTVEKINIEFSDIYS